VRFGQEQIMIARIARWDPFPDTPWVAGVGCSVPGVLSLYHLIDDSDGSGLSVTFAESDTDFDAVTHAIVAENARRGTDRFTGAPSEVRTYRVHAHATRTTRPADA
jgi:hypothetical protein